MPQATQPIRRTRPPTDSFSGLFVPQAKARKRAAAVLANFDACMESFLEFWTIRMQAAGYLSFTTARREDCIAACREFLDPVLAHAKGRKTVTFETLLDNADKWVDAQIRTGLRHCRRGVTVSMYLGCYKTFIMAIEDALAALSRLCPKVPESYIPAAVEFVRLHAHAFEVLWTDAAVTAMSMESADLSPEVFQQGELLRLLTLEKCRFENIFNSTSDGVLVMDAECRIVMGNRSIRQYAGENIEGRTIWDVLDIEGRSPEEFFRYYPAGQPTEVNLFDASLYFRMSVSSLGGMSLASADAGEYLVLLTNITPQVLQRELVEQANSRQAQALLEEKRRLEELNITLRTVLSNIHSEQNNLREELWAQIRNIVLPALERIGREEDAATRKAVIHLLRDSLMSILSEGGDVVESSLSKLTLAELKVCRLVRAGHRTKEVAELLHISPETVQTHRRNIRRKLGLRGHDTQLSVHLLNAGGKNKS